MQIFFVDFIVFFTVRDYCFPNLTVQLKSRWFEEVDSCFLISNHGNYVVFLVLEGT